MGIDVCKYCGASYHPMSVYTKGGEKIWVHDIDFIFLGKQFSKIEKTDKCAAKARADGYVYRKDLTPTR